MAEGHSDIRGPVLRLQGSNGSTDLHRSTTAHLVQLQQSHRFLGGGKYRANIPPLPEAGVSVDGLCLEERVLHQTLQALSRCDGSMQLSNQHTDGERLLRTERDTQKDLRCFHKSWMFLQAS